MSKWDARPAGQKGTQAPNRKRVPSGAGPRGAGRQGGASAPGPGGDLREAMEAARAHLKAREFDAAQQAFESILEKNPEAFQAYMGLGNLYLTKGEHEQALEYYAGALSIRDDLVQAMLMSANIHLRMGEIDQAREQFMAVLDRQPEHEQARIGLANLQARQGEVEQAIETIQGALQHNPQSEELRMALAGFWRQQGKVDAALQELENIIVHNPQAWKAYSRLSRFHLARKNYEQAWKASRKCIEYRPEKSASSFCDLGAACTGMGRFDEAMDAFRKALDIEPKSMMAKLGMARVYVEQNRLEDAKLILVELGRRKRVPPSFHVLQGRIMILEGRFSLAVEQYRAAMLKAKRLLDLHPELSEVEQSSHSDEELARNYQAAFERLSVSPAELDESAS